MIRFRKNCAWTARIQAVADKAVADAGAKLKTATAEQKAAVDAFNKATAAVKTCHRAARWSLAAPGLEPLAPWLERVGQRLQEMP